MKTQKGFIQIPLLIAIVAGVLVVGGVGYISVKQYQDQHTKESANPDSERIAELEKKLAELEDGKGLNDSKQTGVSLEGNGGSSSRQVTSNSGASLDNATLIEKIKPTVVYIKTSKGSGSGFVIESDGYILTNAHVVSGVDHADVTFSNGDYALATVFATNEVFDLALLKVNKTNLHKLDFGPSDDNSLPQGAEVFTFGFPFGLEGDVSFKEGTVSRRLEEGKYLEISAEIHPGNSGGPLVNRQGQVVGINTAIYSTSQVQGVILGETIKFAMPSAYIQKWLPYLKKGQSFRMPDSSTISADCVYTEGQKQKYLSFVQTLEKGSKSMLTGEVSTLFVWQKISNIDIAGASADLNTAMSYFDSAKATFESLVGLIPSGVPGQISSVMNDVVNLRKEVLGYEIQATVTTLKLIDALETNGSVIYLNSLRDEEDRYSTLAHDRITSMVTKETEFKNLAGSYFCE